MTSLARQEGRDFVNTITLYLPATDDDDGRRQEGRGSR